MYNDYRCRSLSTSGSSSSSSGVAGIKTGDNELDKVKAETDVVLLKRRGMTSKRITRLPRINTCCNSSTQLTGETTTTRRHSCQN